ncbi:MAG TPA: IS110 family transposase, partial [Thermoplasmatales archaeon]|nr:IS110 family transposase [Thermoplasmatales archaeon]
NRFSRSEKLSSYFGLAPSTQQSGNKTYYGNITKEGPAEIRWLLIQCAWTHVNHCKNSFLTKFYDSIARTKGKRTAIVATARKMARVIYWMLKNKEPFHIEGYEPR